jgi:hypothetical protein
LLDSGFPKPFQRRCGPQMLLKFTLDGHYCLAVHVHVLPKDPKALLGSSATRILTQSREVKLVWLLGTSKRAAAPALVQRNAWGCGRLGSFDLGCLWSTGRKSYRQHTLALKNRKWKKPRQSPPAIPLRSSTLPSSLGRYGGRMSNPRIATLLHLA